MSLGESERDAQMRADLGKQFPYDNEAHATCFKSLISVELNNLGLGNEINLHVTDTSRSSDISLKLL